MSVNLLYFAVFWSFLLYSHNFFHSYENFFHGHNFFHMLLGKYQLLTVSEMTYSIFSMHWNHKVINSISKLMDDLENDQIKTILNLLRGPSPKVFYLWHFADRSWRNSLELLDSSTYLLPQHLPVLDVKLVQSLYVVGREGDGHQQDVLLPSFTQTFDHLVRLRSEPRHGPHLNDQTQDMAAA